MNDDNGGNYLGDADIDQLNNAVIAGQALPSLAVDANGNLTVIWYDARTDSSTYNGNPGTLLSVYGTVSTDGGNTFSPNFAVATQNFNPYNGVFVDGERATTTASSAITSAWPRPTASLTPSGPPPTAQAVPRRSTAHLLRQVPTNAGAATACGSVFAQQHDGDRHGIGTVSAQEIYSRLNLPPGGSNEWFQLTAGATGELSATVAPPVGEIICKSR